MSNKNASSVASRATDTPPPADNRPLKRGFLRFLLYTFLLALLFVGAAGFGAWRSINTPFSAEVVALPTKITVDAGSGLRRISQQLEKQGLVESAWLFELYMRTRPAKEHIKKGEYALQVPLTTPELADLLVKGEVIQYPFTIIAGWTLSQLLDALAANTHLVDDIDDTHYTAVAASLGIDDPHPEGWFLPETYFFTRGASHQTILKRAHQALNDVLDKAWQSRQSDLPIDTPKGLLTLASIVEKETGVPYERAKIAGVFVNRLNKDMRLQTDPTVIYGIRDRFDGDIRRKDLREDTPYNTYVHKGLPPTPIALPSREAIQASAQPESVSELFFVADGSGGHKFSDTLAEHEAAVRKYILNQ